MEWSDKSWNCQAGRLTNTDCDDDIWGLDDWTGPSSDSKPEEV